MTGCSTPAQDLAAAASGVTVTEITGGMRTTEGPEVNRLLSSLRLEPVGDRVAFRAGEFMRQFHQSHSGIGLGDYLVAATAEVRGPVLATLNIRHYPMFNGLVPPFKP